MNARKVFAFAVLAGLASPTVSQAADLATARPMPVKAAPMIAPAFSWQGSYIGAHGGYAWGEENDNQSEIFECEVSCTPSDKFDVDGFIAGGHIGYNWQSGQFVFGIEGDVDATGLKGDSDFSYYDQFYGTLGFKSQWQASVRLRAGYAINTTLLYVTGGVAFAGGKMTEELYDDALQDPYVGTVTDSQTHVGWTFGGGIERAFSPNWIGRLEARYTDFGSKTYTVNDGETVSASWTQVSVTGGISYKF
jgi:outer membrane immunogenic protein